MTSGHSGLLHSTRSCRDDTARCNCSANLYRSHSVSHDWFACSKTKHTPQKKKLGYYREALLALAVTGVQATWEITFMVAIIPLNLDEGYGVRDGWRSEAQTVETQLKLARAFTIRDIQSDRIAAAIGRSHMIR